MPFSVLHRRMPRTAAALGAALFALMGRAVAAPGTVVLPGHVPAALARAHAVGAVAASQPVSLTLTLPLRNQATLTELLRRLYDKNDPLYGQYLTPDQFAASFGPTQADYDRVTAFAQAQGLTVTGTSPNRTILDVSGTAAQVDRAFGVQLGVYQSVTDGATFYASSTDPVIPSALAGVISGVVGLDNAAVWHPMHHLLSHPAPFSLSPILNRYTIPSQTGSGPFGGLSPSDIETAYSLAPGNPDHVTQTGSGQTLGLFELDGYSPYDVAKYEDTFGLPHVPLQNVRIDGDKGTPSGTGGQEECTLDIELQAALAPGASKIIVYEAPYSGGQGGIDLYTRIATDNLAKQVSTSWGLGANETDTGSVIRNAENVAFQQMAAQGQSMYAASGDSGAYADNATISVNDPASQPFVTGVGGTSLTTNGPGGSYTSETSWNGNGAGGGGISVIWPIPSYQVGIGGAAGSLGSTTRRNVPDVSLDADPQTGYSFYVLDQWGVVGGTSCAAPLWAGFTALVNQQRATNGLQPLGFVNPTLYSLYNTPSYTAGFHDIADGSTNLFYPAVTGYDDSTGLGTFKGASLLSILAPLPLPAAPTALKATNAATTVGLTWTTPTGAPVTSYTLYRGTSSGGEGSTPYQTGLMTTSYTDTAVTVGTHYYYQVAGVNATGQSPRSNEVVGTAVGTPGTTTLLSSVNNGGFENGLSNPAPWVATSGVINNSSSEPAHAGAWKAWLDGYGVAHTDTLTPTVTIPATANVGTLTFYLHVDTAERSRTTQYDTLQVQVRDLSGNVLGTIPVASNLDAASGYVLKTVTLTPYLGKACQITLVGKEDSSLQTSFVVDDFTLIVQ